MPASTVIKLIAKRTDRLPATNGKLIHSAFLKMIEHIDPETSALLHENRPYKPFTISPLIGDFRKAGKWISVRGGNEYWFRVTTLADELHQYWIQSLIRSRLTIHLARVPFLLSEVLMTPHKATPWAIYQPYHKLWEQAENASTFILKFESPTLIKRGSRWIDHPDSARALLLNVAKKWNIFARNLPPIDLDTFAGRLDAAVTLHAQVQTAALQYKGLLTGFQGICTVTTTETDPEFRHRLNLMGNYAFFTGIGAKTTQGMGQVRRIPEIPPNENSERINQCPKK
ncbi:MAG: CRISPR-associated endoribonuclease Cas6 [Gemmatimonadetes bacterium]|nr:MAG: CRISPR-associated endoribonuclease Cas6 [Gemmatimonadota bacterium]